MWKLKNKKETNEFNEKWMIPKEIHMKQIIDRQKEFWNLFFEWVFISPVPSMLRLICEPTSSVLLRLLVAGEDPILKKRKIDNVMLEEKWILWSSKKKK